MGPGCSSGASTTGISGAKTQKWEEGCGACVLRHEPCTVIVSEFSDPPFPRPRTPPGQSPQKA